MSVLKEFFCFIHVTRLNAIYCVAASSFAVATEDGCRGEYWPTVHTVVVSEED